MTFAKKGIGDVHLAMESEAYLEVAEAKGALELIYPSLSILHEPQVAIVDSVVDEKGTRGAAEAYLKFLYTKEGQEIISKHYYRPTDADVAAKIAWKIPRTETFSRSPISLSQTGTKRKASSSRMAQFSIPFIRRKNSESCRRNPRGKRICPIQIAIDSTVAWRHGRQCSPEQFSRQLGSTKCNCWAGESCNSYGFEQSDSKECNREADCETFPSWRQ